MNKIITLDKLDISKSAKIVEINSKFELKNRLEELGIIKDSIIRCEFRSPFNDPTAYFVKGSTIALRCEDARNIKVIINE